MRCLVRATAERSRREVEQAAARPSNAPVQSMALPEWSGVRRHVVIPVYRHVRRLIRSSGGADQNSPSCFSCGIGKTPMMTDGFGAIECHCWVVPRKKWRSFCTLRDPGEGDRGGDRARPEARAWGEDPRPAHSRVTACQPQYGFSGIVQPLSGKQIPGQVSPRRAHCVPASLQVSTHSFLLG